MLVDDEVSVRAQLERRRGAVAARWNLTDELVLIGAGAPIAVPGRGDRIYTFRSHSEYLYLTDRERPHGVLAFDPTEGWVDFVVPVTRDELLWEGGGSGDDEGVPIEKLDAWLGEREGRRVACLGAPVAAVQRDEGFENQVRAELNFVRRQKDDVELARMRAAEAATSAGFAHVVPMLEPGRTEREIQIELEAEFFRSGADFLGFDTIVGSGPNSAVLHFAPSQRRFESGDLVLIDAGAEVRGYVSDVTRTYPASGAFSPDQVNLHAVVRAAAVAGTARCTSGTGFREVHLHAATVMAEGLVDHGLLRGRPDDLVERGAVSLFFPHGIGHMVGLGVRDASEVRVPRRDDDSAPRLRVDVTLLPGHTTTIEPGVYFVPALLNDATLRERHRDAVDWDRVDDMIGFGGIRIEDNILVTEGAPEVLTQDIPLGG